MGLTFHKSWNPFTSSLYLDLLSRLGPHHVPHHEHCGSYMLTLLGQRSYGMKPC